MYSESLLPRLGETQLLKQSGIIDRPVGPRGQAQLTLKSMAAGLACHAGMLATTLAARPRRQGPLAP